MRVLGEKERAVLFCWTWDTEFRDTNSLFVAAFGGSSFIDSDPAHDSIFGLLYMLMIEEQESKKKIKSPTLRPMDQSVSPNFRAQYLLSRTYSSLLPNSRSSSTEE